MLMACDKDVFDIGKDTADETYMTVDKEPISTYLNNDSLFRQYSGLLKYSDMYNALNQSTSGVSFTAFAPTDEAMKEFYLRRGVSGYEELGKDYCRSFALYHTVKDSILPENFILKTQVSNLSGDIINIAIDSLHAGQATLNDEGQVVEMGLSAYNGKIYVLSKAMTPLVETVYDRIAQDAGSTIMTAAIERAGWKDDLNTLADTITISGKQNITKRYYTFFNVTDATFAKAGINSADALVNKLGGEDKLKDYISYHVMENSYTLDNLYTMTGSDTIRLWNTAAENQIMAISSDTSMVNYTINAKGVSAHFNDDASDVLSKNGYVHEVDSWLPIWEPQQTTVVWDFADNTDVRNAVVKGLGLEFYQPEEPTAQEKTVGLTDVDCFEFEISKDSPKNRAAAVQYATCTKTLADALNHDRVCFNVGYMGSVTMKTPTLVKGKYKVELTITYTALQSFMKSRTGCKGGEMKISFDGENEKFVAPYTNVTKFVACCSTSTLYDEIEFDQTAAHTFKFVVTDNAASTNSNFSLQFDKITFTPIE